MIRMVITEDEEFPVYGLAAVDPDILAGHPDAGVEMDQSLIDEYARAEAAWRAVQRKLGVLARAAWQERFGPPHAR
jgi:hypothetical protein